MAHNVYVVELDRAVLKDSKFMAANPNCDRSKACFYVGMTGLTPEERFENHKRGHKASRFVKKCGKWLRRRMYRKLNPMTYEEAQRMEVLLAERLRAKGHGVWQH